MIGMYGNEFVISTGHRTRSLRGTAAQLYRTTVRYYIVHRVVTSPVHFAENKLFAPAILRVW